jgi:predicted secreted protein
MEDPAVRYLLTHADAGRRITIRVGERIRVSLPEGTTGFRWALAAETDALRQVGDKVDARVNPRGRPGERLLTFEALRTGDFVLRLVKRREPDRTVADEFAVSIEIRD